MRKFLDVVKDVLAVVIVLAITFGAGYFVGGNADSAEEVVAVEDNEPFDIELPLEVEKRVVTVEEVESKLVEIGELSTYSGEYTCTFGKDERDTGWIRYLFWVQQILSR